MNLEHHDFTGGQSGEKNITTQVSPPFTHTSNPASRNANINLWMSFAHDQATNNEEQEHHGLMNYPGPDNVQQVHGYNYHHRHPFNNYASSVQNFPGYICNDMRASTNPHISQGFVSHSPFAPRCMTGDHNMPSSSCRIYSLHRPPLPPQSYLEHENEPSAHHERDSPQSFCELSSPERSIQSSTHELKSPYRLQIMDESCYQRRIENPKKKRVSDYPKDPDKQREIIQRIFDAIKNVEDVEDGEKVKAMFRDQKIPDEAIEVACWEIMLRTKNSQECGQLVPEHHKTKHEQWEDFSDRMEEIIEILKYSKAVCKQILQPNYIDRVADQPRAEHARKGCNQKLNKKKAKQNKLGKMVIDAGLGSQVQEIVSQQKIGSAEGNGSVGISPATKKTSGRKRRISDMDAETLDLQEAPPKSRIRRTSRRLAIKCQTDGYESEDDHLNHNATEDEFAAQESSQPQVLAGIHQSSMIPSDKSPLEVDYMVEILKILGLRIENYIWYNLEDLRLYAHAYNSEYETEKWYHPDLPKGLHGLSTAIYHDRRGLQYAHFSEYLDRVRHIAIDREDVDKDGVYNPGRPKRFFTIEQVDKDLKHFQEQALGIAPNKFGVQIFHEPFNF